MRKKICKRIIKGILIILIWLFYEFVLTYHYKTRRCYENIREVHIGDDIDKALRTMRKGGFYLIFLKETQEIDYRDRGDDGGDHVIIFPYKDEDPMSHYPRIYYNSKTGKVVGVSNGGGPI